MGYVTDMTSKRAELTPHETAFVDSHTGRKWSFEEVDTASARLASGLLSLGLAPGSRVAILCLNCPEFFIALFACQKSGLILAPLNWRQPEAEMSKCLEIVSASVLIFDSQHEPLAMTLARAQDLRTIAIADNKEADASLDDVLKNSPKAQVRRVPEDDPWYLLLTSGTTGAPKAVIQTPRMAWATALNIAQAVGLGAKERSVTFLPLFHTGGINLHTLPLFLFGGQSRILPKFDPDQLLDLIGAGEITHFFGVPAIYQAFSLHKDIDALDLGRVKSFACGGAPLSEPLIHFFAERGAYICNGYGMTESGPTGFLIDPEAASRKIGSIGKPQMLTEARIDGAKETGEAEGEILLRGPTITPGYFGNEQATTSAFTADGWLKTGDIGRRDGEGYYFIVDRIKDMYISGGENVYPAEVERVLNEHPAILESAVIGILDEKWGEVGAAFLLLRPEQSLDVEALRLWCRDRLAAYKVPKLFRIESDLPRTAAGKVRKPLLKELLK